MAGWCHTRRAPSHAASRSRASSSARRVSPCAEHPERAGGPVEPRLGPPHEPVADEDREHVVAVLALGGRDVHLEAIAEAEERLGPVAVRDQLVERREQRDPVRDRAVLGVGVGVPPVALEADAARAEAELGEPAVGLAQRDALHVRVPPLGEVPQPLPAAAADDRDLAAVVERVQHLADARGSRTSGGRATACPSGPRARGRGAARAPRARRGRSAGSRGGMPGSSCGAAPRPSRRAGAASAPGAAAASRSARRTRSTRRACRSTQSSRSSSAVSNAPRRLQRTRCCGVATAAIGSSWRNPSRRTVSRTLVADPSRSCDRTAIRRASSIPTFRVRAARGMPPSLGERVFAGAYRRGQRSGSHAFR